MNEETHKANQIAYRLCTKLFYVVSQARTTNPAPGKLDKWFNLETPTSDLFTLEDREAYKSISSTPPPPLVIQVLLTVPDLAHNQVLVHLPPDSSRVRIHPTPRAVLLETFVLDFTPAPAADVLLPTIYKHAIPLFRSLFTLLRVLPAWKLHKRLRRRAASLGITLRVGSRDVLSLTNAESKTYTFPSLLHPKGTFTLSITYLLHPTFQLDELESVLSSRFLSQDHGQRPFTPTLAIAKGTSTSDELESVLSSRKPTLAKGTSTSSSPPRHSSLPRSSLAKHPGTPPRTHPDSSTSSLSPSNSFYTATAPRYPFPFKSNTVSSSLGSSSPSQRDTAAASPLRPVQRASPEDVSASTSSGTGMRKRYSSSFGHRYAPTPSPSSSPARPVPVPVATYSPACEPVNVDVTRGTGTGTDEEDLSRFVRNIDTRRPLRSRSPSRSPAPAHPQQESRSPPAGLVLTTEEEIDRRLLRMNEEFLRSLRGFEGVGAASGVGGDTRREPSTSGTWRRGTSGERVGRGASPWRPAALVRQGSQEVVGRMDIYGEQEGGEGEGEGGSAGVGAGGRRGRFRF